MQEGKKGLVLVTGGSSGLGYEIARVHLKNGDNVCILGRDHNPLNEAVKDLRQVAGDAEIFSYKCNVANEEAVSNVFKSIQDKGYQINCLYNIAGIGLFGEPEKVSREMIDKLLEGNFIGLIVMSTHAIRAMKEDGGKIINVMSSAAKKANANESVYCGVKWGARGYSQAIAAALKGSKIQVMLVYPGGMNTPFWEGSGMSPDLSKFMKPDEVANSIYNAVMGDTSLKISEIAIDRR